MPFVAFGLCAVFFAIKAIAFNTNKPVAISVGGTWNTNKPTSISVGSPFMSYWDTNTTAFALRAGSGLSLRERVAVDALVRELKAANLWTNFYAFYPLVGITSNSMACNLITNQYNITWHGTNTFALDGVYGDGESGYGDTGFNPVTAGAKTNSFHIYAWAGGGAGLQGVTVGVKTMDAQGHDAAFYMTRESNNENGAYFHLVNTNAVDIDIQSDVDTTVSGNSMGQVNGTNTFFLTTGSFKSNSIPLPPFFANTNCYILASSSTNGAEQFLSNDQRLAAVSIGYGMTAAKASNYFAIMTRFQTYLNRVSIP